MNWISQCALDALLEEVALDYKPGLVCQNSVGSHTDMTFETFKQSIKGLAPHFKRYEQLGREHSGSPQDLFEKLRQEGIHAEKSMFKSTHGINTHKGANFIHALLIGASAYLIANEQSLDLLHSTLKSMCAHLADDFAGIEKKKDLTHGEKIYQETQHMGIRQEAIDGFPILFDYPFSKVDDTLISRYTFLFNSMALLFDTTIVHRAGLDGLKWTQAIAQTLNPHTIQDDFESINQQFIKRWISPGGSADFLSASIFIHKMTKKLEEELTYGHN